MLADTLGLKDVETIPPFFRDDQGRQWGLLRRGRVEEQSLSQFLETVRSSLNAEGLRYVDGAASRFAWWRWAAEAVPTN